MKAQTIANHDQFNTLNRSFSGHIKYSYWFNCKNFSWFSGSIILKYVLITQSGDYRNICFTGKEVIGAHAMSIQFNNWNYQYLQKRFKTINIWMVNGMSFGYVCVSFVVCA